MVYSKRCFRSSHYISRCSKITTWKLWRNSCYFKKSNLTYFFFKKQISIQIILYVKLIGDVNVVVVSKAAKCIALLAKGLRQDFKEAKGCIGVLLEKLKEKKATVVEPIREALDNIFDTGISLLDVDEGKLLKKELN